jgi:hypothetical protein
MGLRSFPGSDHFVSVRQSVLLHLKHTDDF